MSGRAADGFILKDGTFIAIQDVEQMHRQAVQWLGSAGEVTAMMCSLGRECAGKGDLAAAQGYFEKALAHAGDDAGKAACLLALGQILERRELYSAAARWYRKAFALRRGADATWYFLNNNLGYCLNRLGDHHEALACCRAALAIDRRRHNAHKNLGIALEALGRHAEAARSYLRAAEICPADPRALRLLQALLARSPRAVAGLAGGEARLAACVRAAQLAAWPLN